MRVPATGGPGLVIVPVPRSDGAAELGAALVQRLVAPLTDCWWSLWIEPSRLVSESLSALSEIDWLEATGYEDAADQLRTFHRAQCMRAMYEAGGSISLIDCVGPEPPGDRRVCAGKGAAVFGMLKRLVGEEAYCASLRSIAESHGGGPVDIGALLDAFERESGEDLRWFFYEWLTRDDLPTYALDYEAERADGGGFTVSGTIIQQGEFYRTPVPLTIDLGGWSYEETVRIESSRQRFTLRTEAEPLQILVDGRDLIPKMDPSERAFVHHGRGSIAASFGRWEVAADEFGAAALLEPTEASYSHDYGEALVRLGRVAEGADHLEHAIELEPGNLEYRLAVALLYLRLSDYESGLRHLDEYVRGRPEERAGYVKRAVALVGLSRLDEAAESLERARSLPESATGADVGEADLLVASGMLLEARGETREAISSYEAALAIHPVSDEARRRLGAIMESNRQGTE
jgi:tetratricopeptide (TPR) repeat protein